MLAHNVQEAALQHLSGIRERPHGMMLCGLIDDESNGHTNSLQGIKRATSLLSEPCFFNVARVCAGHEEMNA
eukprot:1160262-Pelagomonas_calceolata.AAC.5